MKARSFKIAGVLCVAASFASGHAQTSPPPRPSAGCALQFQDHYICNREAFQRRLTDSHVVRIDTDRLDLFAARRLQDLVQGLGKTVVTPEQRPDLVFDLSPVDRSGSVDLSPADVALATLSVYDPSRGTGRKSLIWVETFDGQTDRPWPGTVIELLRKFQANALTPGVRPAS